MSRCPKCGTESGMAFGIGDCGCEETFDVGVDFDLPERKSTDEQAQQQLKVYLSNPRRKVIIELEGPGFIGIDEANNLLWLAGFPHTLYEGKTFGSYIDNELQTSATWKLI